MPKRDEATLLDVIQAAQLALEFKGAADLVRVRQDRKTQAAVLHQLLIIGEAVKRLSEPFRTQHAHIPWGGWAKMRDRLIHGYDSVDLAIVWQTLSEDIPGLIPSLEVLLGSEPTTEPG